ncbi:MAG: hypothetical protein AB7K24_22560 [Gemmataceae bacterium]
MRKRRNGPVARLQERFLTILPTIETHARISFRHIPCADKRADRVAETVALAFKWFVRISERGKDATRFPTILAGYAVRAVRSGRRVCGQLAHKDVLSERAQQLHGFCVGSLPQCPVLDPNLSEALQDNRITPVPDQVAFRIDFPTWMKDLGRREQRLVSAMAQSHRTMDLARKFHLSPGRISQLRRELSCSWMSFHTG